MRISLIIVTKNRPIPLAEALESSARALPADGEVIVVDGDPERSAEPVVDALSVLRVGPAEAVLGPSVGRFGQRVLHVPVTGVEEVARDVVRLTAGLGKPPEDRPFAGHVTLARAAGRRGPRVDLRPLCGGPVSARWPLTDVVLFESHLHPHGASYEEVARFPLA